MRVSEDELEGVRGGESMGEWLAGAERGAVCERAEECGMGDDVEWAVGETGV